MRKDLRAMILEEIAWCEVRRGESDKGDDWEDGFILGLYQTLYLIDKAGVKNES